MATTYGRTAVESHGDRELARVQTLARVLDHGLVDPLIGLFAPGIGDALGSVLGLYVVVVATRRRVSPVVIARMLMNLALDMVIGVIPILGDAADFAFKANKRNVALLLDRSSTGGRATARDWAIVVAAALFWLVLIGLVIYGFVRLFHALA
ncbi:MAG: hypothetical protein JWO36_3016 [Myxococcales bacterium]|nr:hypothetical protein [Myxococcales bacterium]